MSLPQHPLVFLPLCSLVVACQVIEPGADKLNGVYRGAITTGSDQEAQQVHLLDGLALGLGLDSQRSLSAEVHGDPDWLSLELARRDRNGHVLEYVSLDGQAFPGEGIHAQSPGGDRQLDWYYDPEASQIAAPLTALAGQYRYQRNRFSLSLLIFADGRIEAYDNLGCAYFGDLLIPDSRRNLYSVALDIFGCSPAADFAYGIASVEGPGIARLVLPLWFDADDRIETWILERD